MSATGNSERAPRRLIDGAAKARFVEALRSGAPREEAARAAGFPLKSLYGARRRDPVFRRAWEWAMELAAVDERGGELSRRREDGELIRIAPKGGRRLQRQRMRWVRFTAKRQQIFLDHFAGTADLEASAAGAGVSSHTVRWHYRRDSAFAARFDEALRIAFARLEAETLRQRLEAQRRLAGNIEPTGEVEREFDRAMKLLARWDRGNGRLGPRAPGRGRQSRWDFADAIVLIGKKLRSMGIPIEPLPPGYERPDGHLPLLPRAPPDHDEDEEDG